MADVFSRGRRSWIMSRIRGKDTKPDIALARLLRKAGYRVHRYPKLPGTPDVAIAGLRIAFFNHGCFWHGHPNCARAKLPESNRAFWKAKIRKNRVRDAAAVRRLRRMGWSSVILWTCEGLTVERVMSRIRRISSRRKRERRMRRASSEMSGRLRGQIER